jgi:hypothetical protein
LLSSSSTLTKYGGAWWDTKSFFRSNKHIHYKARKWEGVWERGRMYWHVKHI